MLEAKLIEFPAVITKEVTTGKCSKEKKTMNMHKP